MEILALILLGLVLGLALALVAVSIHAYRKYRTRHARSRMLAGQVAVECQDNLKRATSLLAALELEPKAFVAAQLPYPAFSTALTAYVLGSFAAELLPDTLVARLAGSLADVRAFNDLYYRLYYSLSQEFPKIHTSQKSTWVDEPDALELRISRIKLDSAQRVQAELLGLVKRIHAQLSELTHLLGESDFRPISYWAYLFKPSV